MAIHSSILAWEIPWTKEPGRLQSIELQLLGYNLATKQQQNTTGNLESSDELTSINIKTNTNLIITSEKSQSCVCKPNVFK